jgi:hypothetical protein
LSFDVTPSETPAGPEPAAFPQRDGQGGVPQRETIYSLQQRKLRSGIANALLNVSDLLCFEVDAAMFFCTE